MKTGLLPPSSTRELRSNFSWVACAARGRAGAWQACGWVMGWVKFPDPGIVLPSIAQTTDHAHRRSGPVALCSRTCGTPKPVRHFKWKVNACRTKALVQQGRPQQCGGSCKGRLGCLSVYNAKCTSTLFYHMVIAQQMPPYTTLKAHKLAT